jgi:transcriptional regulator with GAF, ATPase, and Fis domain
MSTVTAIPIHSGPVSRERRPILERVVECSCDPCEDVNGIVGTSQVLQQALQQARMVAPTDSTVVIYGETGTVK